MTQSPPPTTPPARPPSVTVVAVFAIVVGGMGLACSPFAFLPYVVDTGPNPMLEITQRSAVMKVWTIVAVVLAPLQALMLLAGGIGALRLRAWARRLLLIYAWMGTTTTAIGTLLSLIFVGPEMVRADDPAMRIGWLATIAIAPCSGIAFAVVLLVVLTRREVKRAFGMPEAHLEELT